MDTDYIGFSAEEADELQATFRALLPVSERLGKELKWLDKVARQAHSQLKIAKTACEVGVFPGWWNRFFPLCIG